ncbi:hypothetical protein EDF63_0642 [Curtobacterium sp. JUb34]|uniref:hypothetical protein n=1 Tax=Curtobacterium sp. JUb34 TaxID=2485109 RepID=UPI000F4A2610|nr:hypothetical protein [Curtobacterium sp. JUb34]ROR36516.1 hypothetical protein EDF63_0642 [Curtobacterium sp. JUb34]
MNLRTPDVSGLLLAAVLSITSCAHQDQDDGYLTLTAGEATLSACPTAAPVQVEALRTDGEQIQLPEQQGGGASTSGPGDQYTYQNVGNWGLVAAQADADCSHVQEWGNPEALRRVHKAFGGGWVCP